MTRNSSDFIERRQRHRILTLRNFAYAGAVLFVAFVAITIRSERRGVRTRDYGSLVRRQLPAPVAAKPMPVVQEEGTPIDEQIAADPMLLAPLAREQWLHDQREQAAVVPVTSASASAAPRLGDPKGDAHVAIVGGPEGVSVVQQARRKPVLAGGFGR